MIPLPPPLPLRPDATPEERAAHEREWQQWRRDEVIANGLFAACIAAMGLAVAVALLVFAGVLMAVLR